MVKVGVYTGVTTDVEFCVCAVNFAMLTSALPEISMFISLTFTLLSLTQELPLMSSVSFVYLKRVLESEGCVTSLIHSNELWACYIYLYYISSVVRTIKEDDPLFVKGDSSRGL